jgi:ribbon-helix-helix protein, copG family
MKTDDKIIIKRRGDDGYRVFSVRVREDVVEKIDAIAQDTGRSRNEIIGMLLEFAVDRCSIE